MKQDRLKKVLQAMGKNNIPQMLISDPSSIFYLTGKWIHPGERLLALYLSLNGNHKLFINELFPLPDDIGIEKIWFSDVQDGVGLIAEHVDKTAVVGVDKNWPARFLLQLMELKGGRRFVNSSLLLDMIRMQKDEEERALMRTASRLNDKAMGNIIKLISPKHSEQALSLMLAAQYEQLSAQGFSFDPIIAYGANAANPHHATSGAMLSEGDSIILDIGCRKDSYCSDMTRTVFYKRASEHAQKVYQIVLEANKRAITMIKPGVRFCDIDAAARGCIEQAGYGKYFTHRTGHSIGIDVHDYGDVSAINTNPVAPGMVFSIEPGIYLPGEFGVRIEDLVMVTENGCEVLNNYNKELMIVE